MKPLLKATFFLLLLTLLDFLFRKGFVGHFVPFKLPLNLNVLLLYALFALGAWWTTKRFARSDHKTMGDLGISMSKSNRKDFLIGFGVGAALWGIVALSQSFIAGFSWELRPDFNPLTLIHGLIFIFIADLGTELYMRGYPMIKMEEGYGAKLAVFALVAFEVLKSLAYNMGSDLVLYAVLIPALHVFFFGVIYLWTRRLGASVGIHTGANFITISVFDLRIEQPGQAIPAGIFQADAELEALSMHAIQLPWVAMAVLFSIVVYVLWQKYPFFDRR